MCVSLSAISYNNNPLQLQSMGRFRTKKERKHLERRGYNLCIHRKEHSYENISLDSDGFGSHPVTVFVMTALSLVFQWPKVNYLLSSDRLCMFCNL